VKFLGRVVLLLLLAIVGLGVYGVVTVFDDAPLIAGSEVLDATDLAQAKTFLRKADPRNLKPGTLTTLTVQQQDMEKALNYALDNFHGGRATVAIEEGIANVQFSMKLPINVLGNYLNAQVALSQWSERLQVQTLRLGGVTIPGFMADWMMEQAHQQLLAHVSEYGAALGAINGFSIGDGQVNVVYQWQPELADKIADRGRDLLVSPENQERLLEHVRHLAQLTNDPSIARKASLTELIGPMFLFARARGGDPVEENRAALMAMATYILGVNVAQLLGEPADSIPSVGRHQFHLSTRHDFAQHFLVSAGIASSAGTGLSDQIGLLKELDDSQAGGSGFSFTDLGADRTGVRLAELAISNAENALAVQKLLSGQLGRKLEESVFMANFLDLPEFMPEAEFKQRFSGVGAPAYNAVANDIEARISQMPLFMQLQ
jgi:hypothetical protein